MICTRKAPYGHHPFEQHFGLIDRRGQPKPAAREMRAFADLLQRIDLAHCRRPDSSIALLVPSYLDNQYPFTAPDDPLSIVDSLRQAYVAAREADLPVKLVREADALLWQPAQVEELARGVAAGGVQYGRTSTTRSPWLLASSTRARSVLACRATRRCTSSRA